MSGTAKGAHVDFNGIFKISITNSNFTNISKPIPAGVALVE